MPSLREQLALVLCFYWVKENTVLNQSGRVFALGYFLKWIAIYLSGFWKEFANDIKTVHIKNLSQDFDNCLQKLIKTTGWDGVPDIVQHT